MRLWRGLCVVTYKLLAKEPITTCIHVGFMMATGATTARTTVRIAIPEI